MRTARKQNRNQKLREFGRTTLAATGAFLVIGGLAGAAPAAAAPATAGYGTLAKCGSNPPITIPGGELHYRVDCGSTITRVTGWYKDTRADGKCVRVRIWWPGNQAYTHGTKACPEGKVVEFDHNGKTHQQAPGVELISIG